MPADTDGSSSVSSALCTMIIRSAFHIFPIRLGQILALAFLTSTSLPKYISLNKVFQPDFQAPLVGGCLGKAGAAVHSSGLQKAPETALLPAEQTSGGAVFQGVYIAGSVTVFGG